MTSGTDRDESDEQGGDAVCWAHLLCPGCGAMPENRRETTCDRCGAPLQPQAP